MSGKDARPNIIFLMSDQQRWDCLGKINPAVKTPNLDKLADDGILFDQAVCQAPMCVPSRYSLMTGLYPSQVGVLRNGQYLKDYNMPSDTIAQALKKLGYQTAGFGKTHWCIKGCSTRGFDVRYIGQPSDSALYESGAVMMGDEAPQALAEYNAETENYGPGEEDVAGYIGCTSSVCEANHRDGWVFNHCLDFIDNGIDDDKPLFLYLSFLKPHAGNNIPGDFEKLYDIDQVPVPQQPPFEMVEPCHATGVNREKMYVDYWSKASKAQWQQMILRYWANCSWIDSMFGRVLDKLKEKGVLDNSLIIFLSDHGEMLGERYYRFNKYCLYESSVRVPVILSGSFIDKASKGSIDSRMAELVDVLPTILAAAGESSDQDQLPGRNLLEPDERQGSFCEFHEKLDTQTFMWRKSDYKLILTFPNCCNKYGFKRDDIVAEEMYNLLEDSQEWKNICKDPRSYEIKDLMIDELISHLNKYIYAGTE